MSGGFRITFDENDDVVVEDIPDDIMRALEQLAAANGRTVKDEMRDLLIELSRSLPDESE